eukprot:gene11817-15815_t
MVEMTADYIKKLCKEGNLYTTPHLNDKLYLHYKGFRCISGLDQYVGLKALWLEGNGFTKIEGLENQILMRSLYLHENCIEKIEGIENMRELDTLNLSKNYIRKIENLDELNKLSSINLAHNSISTLEGVEHLLLIPSIQTVDLQHNKIEDPAIVDILSKLPDLRVLYLTGNPVVKHIKNYRRTIVSKCPQLKYLDDRPVFEEERRRTNAWAKALEESNGNLDLANEAERNELSLIRKEKDEADERNFKAFEVMMREGAEIKRQRELQQQQQNNENQSNNVEVNPFSGEAIIPVPESESLRAIREARWGSNNKQNNQIELEGFVPPLPPASDGKNTITTTLPPPPPANDNSWKKMNIQSDEVDEENDDDSDGGTATFPLDDPALPAAQMNEISNAEDDQKLIDDIAVDLLELD